MKRKMGRPKSIAGTLVTCAFELTVTQKRYVIRRAKTCGVSTGEIIRVLINCAIAAEQMLIDADDQLPAECPLPTKPIIK